MNIVKHVLYIRIITFIFWFNSIYSLDFESKYPKICLDCLKGIQANKCNIPLCPLNSVCVNTLDVIDFLIDKSDGLKIVCRDDSSITLKWNQTNDTYYYLEYSKENSNQTSITNMTPCSFHTIDKLTPNQKYTIQLVRFSLTSKILIKSRKVTAHTIKAKAAKTAVTNLNYTLVLVDESFSATVRWTQGSDLSCFYEILWYGKAQQGNYYHRRINLRKELIPLINITNLEFGKKYDFSIISIDKNGEKESSPKWLHITTPSCLDWFKNLSICAPSTPKNLTIKEHLERSNNETNSTGSLKIIWNKTKFHPRYYNITLFKFNNSWQDSYSYSSKNVSGMENTVVFEEVEVGFYYQVKLLAISDGGVSHPAYSKLIYFNGTNYVDNGSKTYSEVNFSYPYRFWIWSISILGILLVILIFIFRKKLKNILKKNLFLKQNTGESIVKYNGYEGDPKWELNEAKLLLNKVVGVGAFGVVQKGWYCLEPNKGTEVAVKMLKARPSSDQISQFYNEIEIMKSVPYHTHIIYLIGVITKNRPNNPLMLVEFCARGDLQSFLRNVWLILGDRSQESKYSSNIICSEECIKVSNKFYDIDTSPLLKHEYILQSKDLLSFARQIVVGMEFLASLKIVHRDLAARNILLTENNTIKISDFGLSRDIYMNNVYHKVTGGKLPFRWMALESLTHQIYTTESDVWSFGIVLWEIVTLGGNPYAAINSEDLLPLLKQNYRMENPINCSEDLHQIMLRCWHATPNLRPTFSELRNIFDKLLESEMQYISLEEAKKLDSNYYTNVKNNSMGRNPSERYIM